MNDVFEKDLIKRNIFFKSTGTSGRSRLEPDDLVSIIKVQNKGKILEFPIRLLISCSRRERPLMQWHKGNILFHE